MFFSSISKIKQFVSTKKAMTTNFFHPSLFVAVFRSGIRDPGSVMGKNQDPGSGKNIPDPQHCERLNNSPCNLIELRNIFCCLRAGVLLKKKFGGNVGNVRPVD
jgi:hypothetical protein